MILSELIERALNMAMIGVVDAPLRASLEVALESLLPVVFGEVGDELAANERTRSLLRRTKDLAVVNGTVELAADTLTAFISESTLYDAADITKRYSLTSWDELVRGELDSRLGHYAMEGESTLRVVEPANTFAPASGPTIALKLTIPCSPVYPSNPATAVDVNDEVVDILIKRLALALRPAPARR